MTGVQPSVCILVLNWNGWQDTIECLESVFRLDYPSYHVIVCDNGSEDGSLEYIKAWAEGRLDVALPKDNPLRHLSSPPVSKPVAYVEYDREQAECGGDRQDKDCRLVLIQTGGNLGFAGGNNVGMRYALARDDFEYVWLLNNDTVVKPDTLSHLVQRMAVKPDAGMCGSTLLYYDKPENVQALGGARFNKWLGVSRHIGLLQPADQPVDALHIERRIAYIIGASMLVSKAFLQQIGLMSEDYFLYLEEFDWILSAKGRYTLAYAPASAVYHKEGRSTGGNGLAPADRSLVSDYYGLRNRLILARKFFPISMPSVWFGILASSLNRIRRRQWKSLWVVVKMLANPLGYTADCSQIRRSRK